MKEKVYEILREIEEEIVQYNGDQMMEDGIVDSFITLEIIEALEDNFDIEIDAEYITKKNFANKDKIVELVEQVIRNTKYEKGQ